MIHLPSEDHYPLNRFALRQGERRLREAPQDGLGLVGPVGSIALTRPLVVPLTQALAGEDVELNAFWAAERDTHRYDYVTFRCSLEPETERPFEKVWVELALSEARGTEVIAWSMAPRAVADATQVKRSAKMGGEAKLFSGEISEERTLERKTPFLQARGEHSPRPYWLFAKTEASPIAGMFALHLVLRSLRGATARGTISARAEISTRTFFLFSSTSPVSGPGAIDFTAGGGG